MRQAEINGHYIEEVIWRGKVIVYLDGDAYMGAFEDAVKECANN